MVVSTDTACHTQDSTLVADRHFPEYARVGLLTTSSEAVSITFSEQPRFGPMLPLPPIGDIMMTAGPAASTAIDAVDDALKPVPAAQIRGGLSPMIMRRVREYVDAHLDETISINALAGVAGLSPFHFARAFKQSEGVPPHNYVVLRRVKRTMELLAETDLPLSKIALAAGFSDQSHCARRFRENVGMCPRDYRWSTR